MRAENAAGDWLLDDFRDASGACGTGTAWRCFTDQVMGGRSQGSATHTLLDERPALRLSGEVSLANNGGFVQVALDLAPGAAPVDASAYGGVALTLCGDGRDCNLHLRSSDCQRPWQSYRATVRAATRWSEIFIPFEDFEPHRLPQPLNTRTLRRVGLVAIGTPGPVDIALARLAFCRTS